MIDIVLFQPEIPPNTGNIIRLCANTGSRLHLIEPIGFHLDDRNLRRAGLDYHEFADIRRYRDWNEWVSAHPSKRAVAFTTKASRHYDRFRFAQGDALVFGPETRGLPEEILSCFDPEHRLRLPMVTQERSLNLANTVAVAIYEAWRQSGFEGGV
jgi:tRNA (cytidine/uridine-2'-O-)-methyltransferase